MDNPRRLAHMSLVKWETHESFSNLEINTVLSRASLEKSDSALYTLLYLGVIEKKLFLDNVINQYSKAPAKELDTETRNALRLGIYQLVFTDKIPEYSAVDESVSLAPKRSRGLVNAVLRSFIRANKKISYPQDRWERTSLEYSCPQELIDLLRESYGDNTAYKMVTYEDRDKGVSLRVNTLLTSYQNVTEELKKRGFEPVPSKYTGDIIKCTLPIQEIKDLIDTGAVFIQDEASRICSIAVGARSGERVADVCACPGGKTFSMAIDMENKGEIFSSDLHRNKLSLIEKGAKRLGIDIISTREQNAKTDAAEYHEYFDRVLCDVPCSGLGVICKKPEIKYKSLDGIRALPSVQYDILRNCAQYVKVGGILVYSTCTTVKEENEGNVLRLLEENDSFEPVDFCVGDIKSEKGMYTFLPHITGTDGFFVAKLKRIK